MTGMIRRVIRTGRSLAVVIPRAMAGALALRHGDYVRLAYAERGSGRVVELSKVDLTPPGPAPARRRRRGRS